MSSVSKILKAVVRLGPEIIVGKPSRSSSNQASRTESSRGNHSDDKHEYQGHVILVQLRTGQSQQTGDHRSEENCRGPDSRAGAGSTSQITPCNPPLRLARCC